MNESMLLLLLLTFAVRSASSSPLGSVVPNDCSFDFVLSESPYVVLRQLRYSDDRNDLAMKLVYEGLGWASVGFNRDGMMVGSSVVIGLPDRSITTANPGLYYLEAKEMDGIDLVNDNGALMDVAWNKINAQIGEDDDDSIPGEWKRSIFEPSNLRRVMEISNAFVYQNSTHTTLQFSRPMHLLEDSGSERGSGTSVSVHPDELNTLIWAVGISNDFGYHGLNKGSHSLRFTDHCSHGTLAPSSVPSAGTQLQSSPPHSLHRPTDEDGVKVNSSNAPMRDVGDENDESQMEHDSSGTCLSSPANMFLILICMHFLFFG